MPDFSNQKGDGDSDTAFLNGIKPVVFIGRVLFVLPRNDMLKKQESTRKFHIQTIITGSLALFYFLYAINILRANLARFWNDGTTSEKLGEFGLPFYAWTMFFVYGYQFTFGTNRLRNVIANFLEANQKSEMSTPFPSTFPRFCYIIMAICMAMGIVENILYDVSAVTKLKEKSSSSTNSTLEQYYIQAFYHLHQLIPYNPVFTIIVMIIVKWGTYGWVYMDIIVITLCRAVTEKFRVLNREVEYLLRPDMAMWSVKSKIGTQLHQLSGKEKEKRGINALTWDSIRDEFVMLSELVLQIQKLVGPLILACYGANMYISIIDLFYWIAPYSNFSVEEESYTYFAFMQFLFRVTIVTYFTAEVHHESHSIARLIHKCSNSLYSLSLERLERSLVCNPVGISLFGSFMIRRSIFVSLISFIFTTEIILLQMARPPPN